MTVFTQHEHTLLGGKSYAVFTHIKGTCPMQALIDVEYVVLSIYIFKKLFFKDQYYF